MIFLTRYFLFITRTVNSRHLAAAVTVLLLPAAIFSQDSTKLPDTIRGYKVHKKVIYVKHDTTPEKDEQNAVINFADPELMDISLTGITFAVGAEIQALQQSGSVDMLMFHDLRVNGISVTIEEYSSPFSFRKRDTVTLPEPAKIFLPTGRMLQAAIKEMRESKEMWTIRGRIFVFGKFRKFGFSHKRVIPVEIDLLMKNPLRNKQKDTADGS